jgi:hypothetical protein
MESKFCPLLSVVLSDTINKVFCMEMECALWVPNYHACNCGGTDGTTSICEHGHPGCDLGHCGLIRGMDE